MGSILLTGGAGYIGSHTAVELIRAGYDAIIADNFSNSDPSVIDMIEKITGKRPKLCEGNVCDTSFCEKIFSENEISSVIHFAGYKAVGESVEDPLKYYANNLQSAVTVLASMSAHGCRSFIFSSSATVYGSDNQPPFSEEIRTLGATNPYGRTKIMIEQIASDWAAANEGSSVVLLRYFNPVGADESGLIGEKPNGVPNNLMPFVTQTAAGIRPVLSIFGNDYDTPDGTCIRDYIHVTDLAKGHISAMKYSESAQGVEAFNLGTGKGTSVLELVSAFEKANGITLNRRFAPRRAGDAAVCFADASKAERILGWKAEKTIEDMCRDAWRCEKYSRNI